MDIEWKRRGQKIGRWVVCANDYKNEIVFFETKAQVFAWQQKEWVGKMAIVNAAVRSFRQVIIATAICIAPIAGGLSAGPAIAQVGTPGTPTQSPTQPRGGGGGGGTVRVDVKDAAKAVGSIFKKKKKKPVEQTPTQTATTQPKPQVIFAPKKAVVQGAIRPPVKAVVKPTPVKVTAPKITPKVTPKAVSVPVRKVAVVTPPKPAAKPAIKRTAVAAAVIAAPVIAAPVIAAPASTEIIAAPPPAPPAPVAAQTDASVVPQVLEAPKPALQSAKSDKETESNTLLYVALAAVAAALAGVGAAAKGFFAPKATLNCALSEGTSSIVSAPEIIPPEVRFNVELPPFSASTPTNLAIIS
jgi:hypothetical protein